IHFFTCTNNANRYFSSVGNQQFFYHFLTSPYFVFTLNSGCPYSTSSPLSTRISTISPVISASISLNSFIASTMHTTLSLSTLDPICTYGSLSGDAALYSVPTIGEVIS